MPDWTRGYQETFEYWQVNPESWADVERLDNVVSCDITRDSTTDKIESAKLTIDQDIECEIYVRAYLSVTQDDTTERFCLGTWLCQSPTADYDGKTITREIDCYSPLQELSDNMPPVGYNVVNANVLSKAYKLVEDHSRVSVVKPNAGSALTEAFVADDNDTWLSYISDLIAKDRHHFALDPYGNLSFAPDANSSALAPVWEYTDDNSSILENDVSETVDWYGIPNKVEVIVSVDDESLIGTAINDDPESPVSTVSRGRTVLKRVTDAKLADNPTQGDVDAYARKVLRDESQLECEVTYTHAYNGTKLGDGVALRYTAHGLYIDHAKVTRQEMKCETGMDVKETATYTQSLWDGD